MQLDPVDESSRPRHNHQCCKYFKAHRFIEVDGDFDFFAALVVDAVQGVKITDPRGNPADPAAYPVKTVNVLKASPWQLGSREYSRSGLFNAFN